MTDQYNAGTNTKKNDELGALWRKQSHTGTEFMSGYIQIDGQKIDIVCFRSKLENPNAPAWRILKSQKREQNSAIGSVPTSAQTQNMNMQAVTLASNAWQEMARLKGWERSQSAAILNTSLARRGVQRIDQMTDEQLLEFTASANKVIRDIRGEQAEPEIRVEDIPF